jgi:hypothetical protein
MVKRIGPKTVEHHTPSLRSLNKNYSGELKNCAPRYTIRTNAMLDPEDASAGFLFISRKTNVHTCR